MNSSLMRRTLALVCSIAALASWLLILRRGYGQLYFDDAYMFYRFAEHVRQGLGFSWNLDGVPTYGMTSLVWALVVLLFSLLPIGSTQCLLLASWIMSGGALVCITLAISRNARSSWLRDPTVTMPLVSLSLLAMKIFRNNARTGMETMLAMALLAACLGYVLAQKRHAVSPLTMGLLAWLVTFTRPEAGLPVLLMIVLSAVLLPHSSPRWALRSLLVFACLVALTLVLTRLYFHSWLPLSFYLKSAGGYRGYIRRWYPVSAALAFLRASWLFIAFIVLATRRTDGRLLILTLVPLLAVVLYLCTITQIMGMGSRYDVPYLPLLVIPAVLVLDARIAEAGGMNDRATVVTWGRHLLVAVAALALLFHFPAAVLQKLEGVAERRVVSLGDVSFTTPAQSPLPQIPPGDAVPVFADVASALPDGSTLAASEVGYLGAKFPRINVIDLAGLNDNEIARNGFSAAAVLTRHPDLIWLPHNDYTWERGVLLTDRAFQAEYEIYAGAFNFSVAIARRSPYRSRIEAALARMWQREYPGSSPENYLVSGVYWNRHSSIPPVEPTP